MKNFTYSSVAIATLVMTFSSAWALNFKTSIQQINLPSTSVKKVPKSDPPAAPGVLKLAGKMVCGDGDVSHYSSEHPQVDFVRGPAGSATVHAQDLDPNSNWMQFTVSGTTHVPTVVGYWITEDGASNEPLPTNANWFPVAKMDLPATTSGDVQISGAYPINQAMGGGVNSLELLRNEIDAVRTIGVNSYAHTKGYRIHAGIFSCLEPIDANPPGVTVGGSSDYLPTSAEIGASLVKADSSSVLQDFDTIDWNDNSKVLTFVNEFQKVALHKEKTASFAQSGGTSGRPVTYKLSKTGDASLSAKVISVAQSIANLTYPTIAADDANPLTTYKNAVKPLVDAIIPSSILGSGNRLSGCNALLELQTSSTSPQYRWEHFAMNLSCRALLGWNGQNDLQNAYEAITGPTALPDATDFQGLKKALLRVVYFAGAVEATQKYIQTASDYTAPRPSCFPNSGPYVNKLIASYPLRFNYAGSEYKMDNTPRHQHPEPLYALSNYTYYHAKNINAVYCQAFGDSQTCTNSGWNNFGIMLPVGDPNSILNNHKISQLFNVTLDLVFTIRAVNYELQSCQVYC